jgi:hypothetical protein
VALSSRALSIVLRHDGRPHLAQRVNLSAMTDLEATGLRNPTERAVYIQMMCSTAYAAAQAGDRAAALQWASEADRALRGLPETRGQAATPVNASVLTPAQVQLYKVGMFWALGGLRRRSAFGPGPDTCSVRDSRTAGAPAHRSGSGLVAAWPAGTDRAVADRRSPSGSR